MSGAALWRTKHLLTKFRDETWVPCGALESDSDAALFGGAQPEEEGNLDKTEDGEVPSVTEAVAAAQEAGVPETKADDAKGDPAKDDVGKLSDEDVAMADAPREAEEVAEEHQQDEAKVNGDAPLADEAVTGAETKKTQAEVAPEANDVQTTGDSVSAANEPAKEADNFEGAPPAADTAADALAGEPANKTQTGEAGEGAADGDEEGEDGGRGTGGARTG